MTGAPIIVTGGAGFIGCNLADRLAAAGERVIVFDSLARPGVADNLAWLEARHGRRVEAAVADVRDRAAIRAAASGAAAIFHFAAQVAVTSSLEDPRYDFEVNLGGTINVLEAARVRHTPVIFASTNKVYGDLREVELEVGPSGWRPRDRALAETGIDERAPLAFHSPYGCSKGASDQYVLDHARCFGLPAAVLRMSCIYGPRQRGSEDQGWVAHFLIRALAGEPITIFGDGRQVRDVLFVDDAVDAYVSAWRNIGRIAGRAFNLGGGPANAVSLLGLIDALEDELGQGVGRRFEPWRIGDQRWYVSDARAARAALDLGKPVAWRRGVRTLARWLEAEAREPGPARGAAVSAAAPAAP